MVTVLLDCSLRHKKSGTGKHLVGEAVIFIHRIPSSGRIQSFAGDFFEIIHITESKLANGGECAGQSDACEFHLAHRLHAQSGYTFRNIECSLGSGRCYSHKHGRLVGVAVGVRFLSHYSGTCGGIECAIDCLEVAAAGRHGEAGKLFAAGNGVHTDALQRCGQIEATQLGATEESVAEERFHAFGEVDRSERVTAHKGCVINKFQLSSSGDGSKAFAATETHVGDAFQVFEVNAADGVSHEAALSDFLYSAGQVHSAQLLAAGKCVVTDGFHTLWNSDAGERHHGEKGIVGNLGELTRVDGEARAVHTSLKSICTQCGDRCRNGDVIEVEHFKECGLPDGRHRIGNRDRGKTFVAVETERSYSGDETGNAVTGQGTGSTPRRLCLAAGEIEHSFLVFGHEHAVAVGAVAVGEVGQVSIVLVHVNALRELVARKSVGIDGRHIGTQRDARASSRNECELADGGDAYGQSDTLGKGGFVEGLIIDTRYGVGLAVVFHRFGKVAVADAAVSGTFVGRHYGDCVVGPHAVVQSVDAKVGC